MLDHSQVLVRSGVRGRRLDALKFVQLLRHDRNRGKMGLMNLDQHPADGPIDIDLELVALDELHPLSCVAAWI